MNVDEYRALTERDLRESEPNPETVAPSLDQFDIVIDSDVFTHVEYLPEVTRDA